MRMGLYQDWPFCHNVYWYWAWMLKLAVLPWLKSKILLARKPRKKRRIRRKDTYELLFSVRRADVIMIQIRFWDISVSSRWYSLKYFAFPVHKNNTFFLSNLIKWMYQKIYRYYTKILYFDQLDTYSSLQYVKINANGN